MAEDLAAKVKSLEEEVKHLRKTLLQYMDSVSKQDSIIMNIATVNQRIATAHNDYLERLHAVFRKTFPDHGSFLAEYDRILGREVGPEEPKKPKS